MADEREARLHDAHSSRAIVTAFGAMRLALTLAMLIAAGPAAAAPPLRFGMDTRGVPGSWVPGLEDQREDSRQTPRVTKEQLQKLQGLEVDVLKALAAQMHERPEVVPSSWFDLESGLVAGRFDLILGSWTPNAKTPAAVVASIPYYDWGLLAAVRAESPVAVLADLEGRRVGHIPDPSVEPALRAMRSSLKAVFVEIKDGDALFDELLAGRLDALLFDSMYVRWRARKDARFRILGEPLNRLGYHVGVRRSDPALLNRVNAAIQALFDSGQLARIRDRWEGAGAPTPDPNR
jgi:ABC-type amino acid transport substrate-binding protein